MVSHEHSFIHSLEVVSKPLIALKSKAEVDEKAKHIQGYVSILKKPTTQLLGVRRGFETTSNQAEKHAYQP